ncbi:MAG: hypothetical protein JSV36_10200 [Anaerolineae bacterium]|nr:MAG: hypothetical protein JSV36_10200 [Anaerolineae bacterium]
MKLRTKILLAFLTLACSLALVPAASAASPNARGGLLRGEVMAIAGDSITLHTPRAEVTLLTDEETVFEVPSVEGATLDDLAVGDFVVVHAVRGGDGTPLARHVTLIPNGSLEDEVLRGVVSAVDGGTFQLRIREGKVRVVTDESTVFRIPEVEGATAADLKAGMPVVVMGQYEGEGRSFHASAVAVIPGRVIRRHVVQGKLTAIEGSTLVLTAGQDADQEKRVLTTDETTFRVPGVEEATIDDLKLGDRIVALGHWGEDEDFVARSVTAIRWRPRRVAVRGQVTAVGEGFLTLETAHRGELTFTVTEETQFRIPGDDDPGLEDIVLGDRVGVIGYRDRDGNLIARGVGKLPADARRQVTRGEVRATGFDSSPALWYIAHQLEMQRQ